LKPATYKPAHAEGVASLAPKEERV